MRARAFRFSCARALARRAMKRDVVVRHERERTSSSSSSSSRLASDEKDGEDANARRETRAPRVEHLVVVDRERSTVEFLVKSIRGVDEKDARELLDMGAVWHATRAPPRETRGVPRTERTRRLTLDESDMELEVGNYLRVHVNPKRFPAAHDVDWLSCVLASGEGYAVVHKPASVSVVPTVDNVNESCLAMLERAMGLAKNTLKPIHRLDVGTEGVLVVGKTAAFTKEFGDMLANRQCTKVYRVLTTNAVPLGVHIHDCVPSASGSRRMIMTPVEKYDEAEEIAKVSVRDAAMARRRGGESGPQRCVLRVLECAKTTKADEYETRVELLTGRTHQIRGQFAALGAPLVGETLYRAPGDGNEDDDVRTPNPDERLGLQASELHVHVDSSLGKAGTVFKAHDPWWVRERTM